MNKASSRNLALSSFIGPEPQQQPLLHAIMLLLSPRCSCSGGPVAWWSRIKRTVHGGNVDKATEKSGALQSNCCSGRLESSCPWLWVWHFASMCRLSPNRSARRVLRRLFSSSPPAALLGLSCQDAQRGAESRAATCGCRESCCCASPKKSPPLSARFTHRRLTANIGMNPQPLPVHHPMRSLLCQMCHISVGMSPFQLVKRRHESRVR